IKQIRHQCEVTAFRNALTDLHQGRTDAECIHVHDNRRPRPRVIGREHVHRTLPVARADADFFMLHRAGSFSENMQRTQARHGNAAPFGIRTTGAVSLHFPIARLRQSVGMSTAESPAIPDVSRTSMAIAALSTVVEWYDFTLYLYFATVLSRVFFGGGARSLLATLAGFA